MVGAFGEVIVMDWGLALDASDRPGPPGKAPPRSTVAGPAGTPCYMAPEQANAPNSVLDERTDQYLLGAILYEILTGTPPHRGQTVLDMVLAAAVGEVQSPAERAPHRPVPEALARVAMKALANNPADRFLDVAAFQAALRDFLGGEQKRREAREHFDRARELLSGTSVGGASAEYARFSEAIGLLQRAVGLWPEDADAAAGLLDAQKRFVARAIQGGDLNLAAAQLAALQAQGAPGKELAGPLARDLHEAATARQRQKLRFRLTAGTAIALLAVVAALAPFAWVQWGAAESNLHEANTQTEIARAKSREAADNLITAEGQRDRARRAAYVAGLRLAGVEWRADNFPRVTELLNEAEPTLRGWDWGHLYSLRNGEARSAPGHRGGTTTLAFSPDGRWLATGGVDRTLRFVDVATGKELAVRKGFSDALKRIVISPDGTRLAVLAEAPAIIESFPVNRSTPVVTLWDVSALAQGKPPAEKPLLTLPRQLTPTFSRAGVLVTLDPAGVHLYASADGAKGVVLPATAPARQERLAISPDGTRLAVLTLKGTAEVWDPVEKRLVFTVARAPGAVDHAAFSIDSNLLATSNDQMIRWWNVKDGKEVRKIEGLHNIVQRLAFSPDGSLLVAAVGKEMRCWGVADGKELRTLTAPHLDGFSDLAFSADGSRLLAVHRLDPHGLVAVWDMKMGMVLRVLRGHVGRTEIALAPDGVFAATGDDTGAVKFWDAGTDPSTRTFPSESAIEGLAFAPDGRLAVLGRNIPGAEVTLRAADAGPELRRLPGSIVAFNSAGGQMAVFARAIQGLSLRLWNAEGTRMIRELKGPKQAIRALAYSPDGRFLASAGGNNEDKAGEVFVWDTATGELVAELPGCEAAALAVAFSPNGGLLVAVGGHLQRQRWGEIKVWDMESREEVGKMGRQPSRFNAAAFASDGRLATAGSDGFVRVWDLPAGKELFRLTGHRQAVLSVAFSPDGGRLATCGDDKTVRLWESVEGKELLVLDEPEVVSAVAFSPDGHWLACRGGTILRIGSKQYVTLRKALFPATP